MFLEGGKGVSDMNKLQRFVLSRTRLVGILALTMALLVSTLGGGGAAAALHKSPP
jgi:hypothetical protein